jgi:hypothetical protein
LFDYLVVFVVLFREICRPDLTTRYWAALFELQVFDERVTFLEWRPDFALVDQLRALAIHASLVNDLTPLDELITIFT